MTIGVSGHAYKLAIFLGYLCYEYGIPGRVLVQFLNLCDNPPRPNCRNNT
jgi:hypothetical protein